MAWPSDAQSTTCAISSPMAVALARRLDGQGPAERPVVEQRDHDAGNEADLGEIAQPLGLALVHPPDLDRLADGTSASGVHTNSWMEPSAAGMGSPCGSSVGSNTAVAAAGHRLSYVLLCLGGVGIALVADRQPVDLLAVELRPAAR